MNLHAMQRVTKFFQIEPGYSPASCSLFKFIILGHWRLIKSLHISYTTETKFTLPALIELSRESAAESCLGGVSGSRDISLQLANISSYFFRYKFNCRVITGFHYFQHLIKLSSVANFYAGFDDVI